MATTVVSAMKEDVDPMNGVAERVIVGGMANIGTNANIELFLTRHYESKVLRSLRR